MTLDIFLIRDCGFDGSGEFQLFRNDGGTDPDYQLDLYGPGAGN